MLCWWTMRAEALQHTPKSLIQLPRATEERSHNLPPFVLDFKNILGFALLRYRKFPIKHFTPLKKSLFLPLFSPFCPHSGLSRCSGPAGVVPMPLANQDREEGRNGSPPPPNKTRNTTGPAATMLSGCSRCCQPIGNGSPQK